VSEEGDLGHRIDAGGVQCVHAAWQASDNEGASEVFGVSEGSRRHPDPAVDDLQRAGALSRAIRETWLLATSMRETDPE
jgi:hypothetical protein